jgi:chemosensory pili system protein ChpA (sensor histidine kinase/response regulator)
MDRSVLDRMTPAFEHLLRNCVGHGIETPEARQTCGKSPEGHIIVRLAQEGNDVSVTFEDDGAGLNIPKIRAKAIEKGLIAPEHELTNEEAGQLIFAAGLSTAAQVTGLSGRGIGMDVVRSEVVALGGRIETSTKVGQGTQFRMVLPLTTAVTQVVMLRAGQFAFGVPSGLIEIVRRVSPKELAQIYDTKTMRVAGEDLPFYWAGALLQTSRKTEDIPGRTLPVVIFRSAAQRVAVHVDEVLGNQEVVVKNLGPQLSRLPGLAGITVLASGAAALIYNPVALVKVYGAQMQAWSENRLLPSVSNVPAVQADATVVVPEIPTSLVLEPEVDVIPLVLVVDDSITVRRVTQRLLQREGYRVSLAADGLQALERLQEEKPAIVLSDIEMPRMDGFDLVRNIRADVRLADLPVIMITSRIAEKHREHALELGVDHYLGKPYSEETLLGLIRQHCGHAPAMV